VVNRESWYNGDYQQKYGETAIDARDTLTNAIQLCATECSQGRKLTDWEMKAVLHFLWSIELKIVDLDLSETFKQQLNRHVHQSGRQDSMINRLKNHYYTASPATFADALPAPERGLGQNGNPRLGEAIYELSCRHCHQADGPAHLTLNNSKLTFNKLARHLKGYTKNSIYQITRYGTSPIKGYRPYMPQYPLERLSREQVEHLVAFIQQQKSQKP